MNMLNFRKVYNYLCVKSLRFYYYFLSIVNDHVNLNNFV